MIVATILGVALLGIAEPSRPQPSTGPTAMPEPGSSCKPNTPAYVRMIKHCGEEIVGGRCTCEDDPSSLGHGTSWQCTSASLVPCQPSPCDLARCPGLCREEVPEVCVAAPCKPVAVCVPIQPPKTTTDQPEGCLCTQEYDPVCSVDGKTYGNKCKAGCAGVVKFVAGECKDVVVTLPTQAPTTPGKEGCFCTKEYVPVCGADGKTYGNKCEARCAGVVKFAAGECKDVVVTLPTQAPTTPGKDSVQCKDSSWKKKNKRNKKKGCAWVAKKPSKRCRHKGIDGSRAFKGCPSTCNRCN